MRLTALTKSALTSQIHAVLAKAAGFASVAVAKAGEWSEELHPRGEGGRFAAAAAEANKATKDAEKADRDAEVARPGAKPRALALAANQHKIAAIQHKLAARAAVDEGLADHVIAHEDAAASHEQSAAGHAAARAGTPAPAMPLPKVEPGKVYAPIPKPTGVIPAPRQAAPQPPGAAAPTVVPKPTEKPPAPPTAVPKPPKATPAQAHPRTAIGAANDAAMQAGEAAASADASARRFDTIDEHTKSMQANAAARDAHLAMAAAHQAVAEHPATKAQERNAANRARQQAEEIAARHAWRTQIHERRIGELTALRSSEGVALAQDKAAEATRSAYATSETARNALRDYTAIKNTIAGELKAEQLDKVAGHFEQAAQSHRAAAEAYKAYNSVVSATRHLEEAARHDNFAKMYRDSASMLRREEAGDPRLAQAKAASEAAKQAEMKARQDRTYEANLAAAKAHAAARDAHKAAETTTSDRTFHTRMAKEFAERADVGLAQKVVEEANARMDAARGAPDRAAPKEPMALGRHVLNVVTKSRADEALVGKLVKGMEAHPGLHAALERYPVPKLQVRELTAANGLCHSVRSMFGGSGATVSIDMSRVQDRGLGMPFRPGLVWSMSSAGKDLDDARQRTFVHELAHHFNNVKGVNEIVSEGWRGRPTTTDARGRTVTDTARCITQYAAEKAVEYFAENWTAYHYHPEELRQHDPNGYNMVEKALRHIGAI